MYTIAACILSENPERLVLLQQRLESAQSARIVFGHSTFPAGSGDPIIRRLQDSRAEVVLVDIDPQSSAPAIHAIELVHANVANAAVFAVGAMQDPAVIVAAMRAGAREYLERDATAESFAD